MDWFCLSHLINLLKCNKTFLIKVFQDVLSSVMYCLLHNKSRWHLDLWNVEKWRSYRSSACNCSADVSKLMTNNLWTNISTSGFSWDNCKQYNKFSCEHWQSISSVYFSMQCFQVFFHCICVCWLIDIFHKDVEELLLFLASFSLWKIILISFLFFKFYNHQELSKLTKSRLTKTL